MTEEEFQHTVTAWTVGDLRKALEGVPDDAKLLVTTSEAAGSLLAGPQQVVIAGGMAEDWVPGTGGEPGHYVPANRFELDLEFPSGTYLRPEIVGGQS